MIQRFLRLIAKSALLSGAFLWLLGLSPDDVRQIVAAVKSRRSQEV